jgi:ABC-type transport system substrate-binding protein
MTADDVVFSFWRYKGSQAKMIHGKTEKVEAVNPYLVRLHFKEPFPDFLEYLVAGATSIGWVVPKKHVEKVGDAGFKRNPVEGPTDLSGRAWRQNCGLDCWRSAPYQELELYILSCY